MPSLQNNSGVPQNHPVPILLPLQTVQSVSSSGFAMLSAAACGNVQDVFREHAQLTPGFVILAVSGSGKSSNQPLPPRMANHLGDVTESGRLGSLGYNKEGKLQSSRLHGNNCIDGGNSGFRPAGGINTVSLGNAKFTNKASNPIVGIQPSNRNVPLQGAGHVHINISFYYGNISPTPDPDRITTKVSGNRAEDMPGRAITVSNW